MNYIDNELMKIEKSIGKKIYATRLSQGLSRQQLAKDIGVTNQQVLKYEAGENRITVSRLIMIAKALGKEVSYFYKEVIGDMPVDNTSKHQLLCILVSRNFMKLKNEKTQIALNRLIKSLVEEQ